MKGKLNIKKKSVKNINKKKYLIEEDCETVGIKRKKRSIKEIMNTPPSDEVMEAVKDFKFSSAKKALSQSGKRVVKKIKDNNKKNEDQAFVQKADISDIVLRDLMYSIKWIRSSVKICDKKGCESHLSIIHILTGKEWMEAVDKKINILEKQLKEMRN